MDEFQLLDRYLLIGALLFGIGLIGFLSRRNMIVMFLAAEMMLQGISVSLVAWGRFHNDWGGQVLVIFILTVAACEAAIALALILMLYHQSGNRSARPTSPNSSRTPCPRKRPMSNTGPRCRRPASNPINPSKRWSIGVMYESHQFV